MVKRQDHRHRLMALLSVEPHGQLQTQTAWMTSQTLGLLQQAQVHPHPGCQSGVLGARLNK